MNCWNRLGGSKFRSCLAVYFYRKAEGVENAKPIYFKHEFATILNRFEVADAVEKAFKEITTNIAMFIEGGSGQIMKNIEWIQISKTDFVPLGGSQHPPSLANMSRNLKRHVLSHENDEEKCFLTAVATCLIYQGINKLDAYHRDKVDEKASTLDDT